MQEGSCSRLSLEAGEPLAGTAAAETVLWVALEHRAAWGPKGVDDSGLPEVVAKQLAALAAAHAGVRVQLIRKPERSLGPLALLLARATPGAYALWQTSLERAEDLCAIDLSAWAKGEEPAGFRRVQEALYLVCVHGRRDRCCAQRGMPVYSALTQQAGEQVWQTSHLGGHRFAATLVVLPSGVCYGRVEAEEAGALVAAHVQGRFHDLNRVRGRCAYPSETQAAEVALREQLEERALDALTWLGTDDDAEGVRVRFRREADASEHSVRVSHQALPAFPQSCGASHRPGAGLVALTLR